MFGDFKVVDIVNLVTITHSCAIWFAAARKNLFEAISEALSTVGRTISFISDCKTWVAATGDSATLATRKSMGGSGAGCCDDALMLALMPTVPEGYSILPSLGSSPSSAAEDHAILVNEMWKYKDDSSERHLREVIKTSPTMGIVCDEDGSLAAWALL